MLFHFLVGWYIGKQVHLHSFLMSALDRGEWSASRPRRFTQAEEPPVLIEYEAEVVLELVWMTVEENLLSLPVIERRILGFSALSPVFFKFGA
jgi:hypothetical protein